MLFPTHLIVAEKQQPANTETVFARDRGCAIYTMSVAKILPFSSVIQKNV